MSPPVVLKTDGTRQAITEPLTLATMQRLVGGYIELVTLDRRPDRRVALLVNEDGCRAELRRNPEATVLAGQPIVGDAILCVVLNEGQEDEQYVGLDEYQP